jgi:hypothetical protein
MNQDTRDILTARTNKEKYTTVCARAWQEREHEEKEKRIHK